VPHVQLPLGHRAQGLTARCCAPRASWRIRGGRCSA
jgi:hypothetical protein